MPAICDRTKKENAKSIHIHHSSRISMCTSTCTDTLRSVAAYFGAFLGRLVRSKKSARQEQAEQDILNAIVASHNQWQNEGLLNKGRR